MPGPLLLRPVGLPCPACAGTRRMPATNRPCVHCLGTGLAPQANRLAGSGRAGPGAPGVSPNRFPQNRSASMPVFPTEMGVRLVEPPLPVPPMWPTPAPAGPYDPETSKGEYRMVQTFNNTVAVGLASVQLLPRNQSRKGFIITNPSTTLTVFLDYNNGPANANCHALLPGNSIQFFVGYKEYIVKEGVFAVASGAGPTAVSVVEFS